MIPGLPNPWLLLGGLVVVVGLLLGAYTTGASHEANKWKAAQADQERAVAQLVEASAKQVRAKEQEFAAFKDQTEKNNAEALARINGLRLANGRLVAAAGGLFDRNGRATGANSMSAAPPAAGGAAGGSTGCRLSDAVAGDLLDLARDADAAAVYAQTGHAYAVGLPR